MTTDQTSSAKTAMALLLVLGGVALLVFDIYMSLAMTGFLVPQMVLAFVAAGLIVAGVTLRLRVR